MHKERAPSSMPRRFLGSGDDVAEPRSRSGTAPGSRILVDDVRSINIDSRCVIVSREANVISSRTGCVCCSARAPPRRPADELLERRKRRTTSLSSKRAVSRPSRLLVSLHDPHPASSSRRRRDHARRFPTHRHVPASAPDSPPATRERHLIVFNKTNLVRRGGVAARSGTTHLPEGPGRRGDHASLPLELVLGVCAPTTASQRTVWHERSATPTASRPGPGRRPNRCAYEAVADVLSSLPCRDLPGEGLRPPRRGARRPSRRHVVGARPTAPIGDWGAPSTKALVFIAWTAPSTTALTGRLAATARERHPPRQPLAAARCRPPLTSAWPRRWERE